MSNKSVSDFVAATMDAVLKSEAHKSLFGTQYKFASDESFADDSKCSKCENATCTCEKDTSSADDMLDADDNEAKKKKGLPPWLQKKDESCASDEEEDESMADDSEMKTSTAFDLAIDSLLTASAALDSVGMEKSAAFSLKLASFVVTAKKKDKKDKESKKSDSNEAKDKAKAAKEKEKEKLAKEKEKAAKEKAKAKAMHDSQMAKDKAAKEKEKAKMMADKEKAKAQAEKDKAAKAKASVKK